MSKQTVYDHFGGKEQLFLAVITAVKREAVLGQFAAGIGPAIEESADLRASLITLGCCHLRAVLDPDVMALRRLVIGEVRRFPQLGKTWYEQDPAGSPPTSPNDSTGAASCTSAIPTWPRITTPGCYLGCRTNS